MEILLVLRTILAYIAVLLPGLAFWAWFHNDEDDPAQSLAQILGISFSVIALGALVFHHIGLRVNGWILGIFLAICLVLAVFGIIKTKPAISKENMTAHFSSQQGLLLLYLFFD